jgi:hypothetical protein
VIFFFCPIAPCEALQGREPPSKAVADDEVDEVLLALISWAHRFESGKPSRSDCTLAMALVFQAIVEEASECKLLEHDLAQEAGDGAHHPDWREPTGEWRRSTVKLPVTLAVQDGISSLILGRKPFHRGRGGLSDG